MKKYIESAIDNIGKKTQSTLFDAQIEIKEPEQKKQSFGGRKTTYWNCVKGHVFRHNFAIHKDRMDKLRCPECNSKIKNKSSENSYYFYLEQTGRMDAKVARMKKEKENKKKAREKVGERIRRNNAETSED